MMLITPPTSHLIPFTYRMIPSIRATQAFSFAVPKSTAGILDCAVNENWYDCEWEVGRFQSLPILFDIHSLIHLYLSPRAIRYFLRCFFC